MKEYCRKNASTSLALDDPVRGFVQRKFDEKSKTQANKDSKLGPAGFGQNGDVTLSERFNPNNVELNKRRF